MQINRTEIFAKWFDRLNMGVRVRLLGEINKLSNGIFSNAKPVGDGVHELKVNWQKGYRLYFANINGGLILLLCGGDKSTQARDIKRAKEIKAAL
jgi:putative addiction module killer protein